MRSYFDESKNESKNKNISNNLNSEKRGNLPIASRSASEFFKVSKSKIRNKYKEETNEKIDFTNKNNFKELLLKKKSMSKLANYDSYMLPPTANDVGIFSSRNSFNSYKGNIHFN